MTDRGAKTMVRAVRVQIPEILEEIKQRGVRVDSGELFNEYPPPVYIAANGRYIERGDKGAKRRDTCIEG